MKREDSVWVEEPQPKCVQTSGRVMQIKTSDGRVFCVHENGDRHFVEPPPCSDRLKVPPITKTKIQGFIDKRLDNCWAYDPSDGAIVALSIMEQKGTSVIIQSGHCKCSHNKTLLKLDKAKKIDIKKIYGKPLKPLTWYHLYITETGFRVSEFPETKEGERRIASLHTTTRRTIRRFTQFGNAFTWVVKKNGSWLKAHKKSYSVQKKGEQKL